MLPHLHHSHTSTNVTQTHLFTFTNVRPVLICERLAQHDQANEETGDHHNHRPAGAIETRRAFDKPHPWVPAECRRRGGVGGEQWTMTMAAAAVTAVTAIVTPRTFGLRPWF